MSKTPPLTLEETKKALIGGELTAVSLVDSYLERIKRLNPQINAFLTVTDSLAYKRAKEVDKLIAILKEKAFDEYPLLGVVVAHKDLFLTKGVRTTAGSNVLSSYIPQYSATAVERLEKAGAIMIGKLNQDAWAHGSSGENSDFGPTKNPWDKTKVPGGSSSGSGASLAANLALLTTGTDTCGSVRLPANYCGVYGLKPTYGAVSRYGVVAMASSLDCVGFLGRTAEDVETAFGIAKGPDAKDSTLKEADYRFDRNKIKIGIPKEFFAEGLDSQVGDNVMKAAKVFEKAGIDLVNITLPSTKYGISVYYIIQPAEVSSNLGRYDGIRYANPRSYFSAEAKRRIMLGTYVLSAGYRDAYYLKAQRVRSIIINEVKRAFESVDAIICPVAPTPPFSLGEKTKDPLSMYLTDIYAATANLSGIPSLAIPFGETKIGLPLGFQLMGERFAEPVLFYLAKLFEKETSYQPKVIKA